MLSESGYNTYMICHTLWNRILTRWIKQILFQISLIGSTTGLFRIPDIKPNWSLLWKCSFYCISRQLPARLDITRVVQSCSPWLNHWVTVGNNQPGTAQSNITSPCSRTHIHFNFWTVLINQKNLYVPSTPFWSGNMSTCIPISLSEICKHLKHTTETAQGTKSCPSVSELACD